MYMNKYTSTAAKKNKPTWYVSIISWSTESVNLEANLDQIQLLILRPDHKISETWTIVYNILRAIQKSEF